MVIVGSWTVVRGLVFTGYSGVEPAEAVAVHGSRIAYVGGFEEALRMAGSGTRILDYGDRLVTPGMIDSHCHLSVAGFYLERGVSLLDAESIEEVKEMVAREALRLGPGKWVLGFGLDESRLAEARLPTRWELDEAAPRNPVTLDHISGHLLVANSAALRIAGVGRDTPDPPGGIIDRDEEGEPTGVLRDNAMNLVLRLLPPVSPDAWLRGVARAQKLWVERGFTGVEDTGTFGAWSSILGAYRGLRKRGEMLVRVRLAYALSGPEELGRALDEVEQARRGDDEVLRTNLVKVFYDGSGLARTALLYKDWCADYRPLRGARGIRVTEPGAMAAVFGEAARRGVRVAVHAIGDRAVDEVTGAYASARVARSTRCAASIVHALLVSREGLERLGELGICVKTQPGFIYTHGHVYAANFCEQRARRSFPLRSMLRRGVVVASGTDAPFVGSPDPVEGLYGAVYRKPRRGARPGVFGREEAISFAEALETYTRLSAEATGWIDVAGTLEPGKHADLVVWSIGTLSPGEEELRSMRPLAVMVGGRLAYNNVGHET